MWMIKTICVARFEAARIIKMFKIAFSQISDNFNVNLFKNKGFLTYILRIQSNALQITSCDDLASKEVPRSLFSQFFLFFFQMVGKEPCFSLLTVPST